MVYGVHDGLRTISSPRHEWSASKDSASRSAEVPSSTRGRSPPVAAVVPILRNYTQESPLRPESPLSTDDYHAKVVDMPQPTAAHAISFAAYGLRLSNYLHVDGVGHNSLAQRMAVPTGSTLVEINGRPVENLREAEYELRRGIERAQGQSGNVRFTFKVSGRSVPLVEAVTPPSSRKKRVSPQPARSARSRAIGQRRKPPARGTLAVRKQRAASRLAQR